MSDSKREAVEPVAWQYAGLYPNSVPPFRKDRADGYTIPLIPATTLTDMQRRLEAVESFADELTAAPGHESVVAEIKTMLRTLLRDGKGDGVSTAEGEG